MLDSQQHNKRYNFYNSCHAVPVFISTAEDAFLGIKILLPASASVTQKAGLYAPVLHLVFNIAGHFQKIGYGASSDSEYRVRASEPGSPKLPANLAQSFAPEH